MPTYQYACKNADCGNEFELVQAFTDPSVSECPVCSGPVRKVYGSVGVTFKGSGFYRTDSRAGSSPSAASSASSSSDTGSSKSSSSSSSSSAEGSSSSSSGGGAAAAAAAPAT